MSFGFLSKSYIILDYSLSVKEYTEMYCENKDEPELECNGKCHLGKTIRLLDETSAEGMPKPSQPDNLELSHCLLSENVKIEYNGFSSDIDYSILDENISEGYLSEPLMPPELNSMMS